MQPPLQPPPTTGINLGDIYYVLFRHKWKIVLCSIAGIAAGLAYFKLRPPAFQSDAKLFVRYVVSDGRAIGPTAGETVAKSPDQRGETIMNSEAEILGSTDLARAVAEAIGPERILAKMDGEKTLNRATTEVKKNLTISIPPRTSVIRLSFRYHDPEVIQPILREVIDRYLTMHVSAHRTTGVLGDLLLQETDQLRARLLQTEDELRKANNKAGVISLDEAQERYGEQIAGLRQQIFAAEAELAERTSLFQELTKRAPAAPASEDSPAAPAEPPLSAEAVNEYRNVITHIANLQRIEQELLTQFTAENARVKAIRAQLDEAEGRRRALQAEHPTAFQPVPTMPAVAGSMAPPASNPVDLGAAAAEITGLRAKINVLNSQLGQLRTEAARIDELAGTILELRRKKELDEANYRYYAASLEQARINETLGNGRIANIIPIQTPSPPSADWMKLYKMVVMIAGAGFGAGIAWAFLIEMFVDRSIRRPIDVERSLGLPLFIAIPIQRLKRGRRSRRRDSSPLPVNGTNGSALANGFAHGPGGNHREVITALAPFHETLRDRLIGYFESRNLTHKPKLVAVSGLENNAGVTSIAAGLSRSLSETGEGNVLLVDMTAGQGSAQQFIKGREVCDLDELLTARDSAHVQENLYVVTGSDRSNQLSRNLPQRFTKLVPKLKASDFDYIIFDMPVVSQISITPRLAAFMDMVLLVVESEKTDRDLVQKAAGLLADSKAHVGVVLNKMRTYVPARLHPEF